MTDRDDLIEARRIIRCAIAATKANISNGTVPAGTWLSEARAFLERTERTDTPPTQEAQRSDLVYTATHLLAMKDRLLAHHRSGSRPSDAFWRDYDEGKRRWERLTHRIADREGGEA